MEILLKPRKFTAFIPATPCSEDMRRRVVVAAEGSKVSLAEVVRVALERFHNELEQMEADSIVSSKES